VPVHDEGQQLRDHDDILVLPAVNAANDIVIKLNGDPPFQVGTSASIDVHIKGSLTEIIWMVR
jgi:hypothetical protein